MNEEELRDLLLLKDRQIATYEILRKDLLEKIDKLVEYQDKLEGEIKLLNDKGREVVKELRSKFDKKE